MDYQLLYDKATRINNNETHGIFKNINEYAFTFVYPPPQTLYKLEKTVLLKKNERDMNEAVNLYMHIPYCTGKCKFCYFCCYELSKSPIRRSDYVKMLCKEIELINKNYGEMKVKSIHFGGGTPTTLSDADFNAIFKALNDNMKLEKDIEITCESSPETLTSSKLDSLYKLGVNRLNIGIQTLDDSILKYVNRRHDSKQALNAMDLAHKHGFSNVNVDLIYGLPEQSLETWGNDLKKITERGAQSISTYRLRVHPSGKLANEKNLNKESELIRKYVKTLEIMDGAGYVQCSSHKFASEKEFVQKQIVSKRGIKKNELLSIGMSSYGYLGSTLYWNCRDIGSYQNKLNNNELPYEIGYELNKREQMSKACVLGLHNLDGIDLSIFESHFGTKFQAVFGRLVNKLDELELIELSDQRLKLTKLGMVFADEIAIQFYSDTIKKQLNDKGLRYGIFFDEIL